MWGRELRQTKPFCGPSVSPQILFRCFLQGGAPAKSPPSRESFSGFIVSCFYPGLFINLVLRCLTSDKIVILGSILSLDFLLTRLFCICFCIFRSLTLQEYFLRRSYSFTLRYYSKL